MDFNAVCDTVSPLLFAWDELPYTHMHSAAAHQQPQQQQDVQHDLLAGRQEQHETDEDVELRVVSHAGMIMPGVRAATGMPLDMLGLQDSFEQVLYTMQQQEQKQQQ